MSSAYSETIEMCNTEMEWEFTQYYFKICDNLKNLQACLSDIEKILSTRTWNLTKNFDVSWGHMASRVLYMNILIQISYYKCIFIPKVVLGAIC